MEEREKADDEMTEEDTDNPHESGNNNITREREREILLRKVKVLET